MGKIFAIIFLVTATLFSQYVPTTSSSISDDAGSVVINPAGLGISRGFNLLLLAPTDFTKPDSSQNDFSIYLQTGRTGFGFTRQKYGRNQFHWSSGEHVGKGFYLGFASHLSTRRLDAIDTGVMYRGFPWFSSSLMWKNTYTHYNNDQELVLGIALRPFGNRFTLAYDHRFAFDSDGFFQNGRGLYGIAQIQTEAIDGLKISVSFNTNSKEMQLGLGFGFGKGSVETYHDYRNDGKYTSSMVGFHISSEHRRSALSRKVPTYIELAFEHPITDSPTPRVFFGPRTLTLKTLVDNIKDMAENPNIDGIILKPDGYSTGLGMMEEVYQALVEFKRAGKQIFAFINAARDAQYALACVADSIFLNSGGIIDVDGIAFGIGFWKGLFEKIGVEAQLYRRGDYKTAAEPYTRERLSAPSREAYEALLKDMQSIYSGMIKRGRGWSQDKLDEIYAAALFTPSMALEAGLIDGIYHPDQVVKKIKQVAGKDVKIIKSHQQPKQWVYDWDSGAIAKIAIIYAEGTIVPGKSQPSPFGGDKMIGSETTTKAIRKAREDKSVKAIVMRVNSPGGSVLASEDIWREVHRTTHPDSADEKNRKPFIISMANVAGSGGYYIACAADTIVADSSTITGSIGVFSGKVSLGALFKKIGYNMDIVKEQPHAEMFGLHRPFTDQEGRRMQEIVDSYYEQFLSRVAEGRGMTRDEVDEIAQGRIWSGIDAQEIGLVDVLGGLDRAIDIARVKAGLKEDGYQLQIYRGVEEMKFAFRAESTSELAYLMAAFETEVPLWKMLDRAKLINDEKFLYLMEEELIFED
ncbi:MAG: signal peptide peptidase SppA [Candidatus Marinimicrobia bacterium]|nr:signal peptide peptidase SppA [Candidatus Neomarinimicrobiota bacterium]